MEPTTLQLIWFVLIGVLMAGYAILDGFDLGVGILHLFARDDTERRVFMNSIGPIWDGNEVWLVVFGGALFAAFPKAYAAAFSGFYLAFMLLLCCLIFRGVSMEFRSKQPWRAVASVLGRGLLRRQHRWRRSCSASSSATACRDCRSAPTATSPRPLGLGDLLNPYSVLTGLFAVSAFAMHGSIYLYLKTEGELQRASSGWMWRTFFLFLALYLVLSVCTLIALARDRRRSSHDIRGCGSVPILNVLAIANIPRAIYQGRPFDAFLSSAAAIAAFTFLFGVTLFPNLIVSTVDPAYSLTVARAASREKTLGIMPIVAVWGCRSCCRTRSRSTGSFAARYGWIASVIEAARRFSRPLRGNTVLPAPRRRRDRAAATEGRGNRTARA